MAKSNDHIYQNIKDNLINFREANNLSGDIVASALNMKPSTYRNYEIGRSTPSVNVLLTMAKIFGVSIERLLEEPIASNKNSHGYVALDGKGSIEGLNFSPLGSDSFDSYYDGDDKEKSYLSELEIPEKLIIMKYRQLSDEDKSALDEIISGMIKNIEEEEENTQQND